MMARLTGKTVYGELGGRKMESFRRTGYYNEKTGKLMAKFLKRQRVKHAKKIDDNVSKANRRRFLLNKYETNGSFKSYFKSELPTVEVSCVVCVRACALWRGWATFDGDF